MRDASGGAAAVLPGWASYHVYYHESLDRAVTELVAPAAASLLEEGAIDRFFFIRYFLGGPHIRLRVRVRAGEEEAVEEAIEAAAAEFFARMPSRRSSPEEVIRRANASILATDPREGDSSVYPDNSLRALPYHPEVERYGGEDLVGHSLDFFTVSSVEAIGFLRGVAEKTPSKRTSSAFRLLLRQALGSAQDAEELARLLAYGVESWGRAFPSIDERAEAVFSKQRESFRRLFHHEVESLRSRRGGRGPHRDGTEILGEAANALSGAVGRESRDLRWRIGGSHLHMTANRLGLLNAEEAYLSRLLVNATSFLEESRDGELVRALDEALAPRPEGPRASARRLEACVACALASAAEVVGWGGNATGGGSSEPGGRAE